MKYKTNIEITSEATNKVEAMEIVGDYLSGNITSGIDMKYETKPVRFYNNVAAKMLIIGLLITIGFVSGVKSKPQLSLGLNTCQMAAVTPPLKTSDTNKSELGFKSEWQLKQNAEAINYIKK